MVSNDVADDADFTEATIRAAREIHEALQEAGLERWPYVRVRSASEQKALQESLA